MDNIDVIIKGGGNYALEARERAWRKWMDVPDPEAEKCPDCGGLKAWDEPTCESCRPEYLIREAEAKCEDR